MTTEEMLKRSTQRAIRQLKKPKYLETDDKNTIGCNNGIDITNVKDGLSSDAETIIFEEAIIKRRNPKRKGDPMQRFDTKKFIKNVGDCYHVQFIKQVPVPP